jgi:hypothetical protein
MQPTKVSQPTDAAKDQSPTEFKEHQLIRESDLHLMGYGYETHVPAYADEKARRVFSAASVNKKRSKQKSTLPGCDCAARLNPKPRGDNECVQIREHYQQSVPCFDSKDTFS